MKEIITRSWQVLIDQDERGLFADVEGKEITSDIWKNEPAVVNLAILFSKVSTYIIEQEQIAEKKLEPLWHFQEKNWPSMNDPKASLCDGPGGDCTRRVENVNCEACLRLLNDYLQKGFK